MSMEIHIKKDGPIKAYTKLMIKYAKLLNENAELEAQIEKMKCCKNCLYNGECDLGGYEECKNFDKWEIKEK